MRRQTLQAWSNVHCVLTARYLGVSTSSIQEDFLQFIPVTDVSGEGLAMVIVDSLMQLGVNLEYMRGQGYDGASAML